MNRTLDILPECYVDTLLVHMLGFPNPNHQFSIGQVANSMKKPYKTRLAIGVVDNDKQQPAYFKKFELIEEKHGLIRKKHPDFKHHLIILCPAFERWVMQVAHDAEVDVSKYGFKNLKQLQRITKNMYISQNQSFKQFLNTLKQKNPPPVATFITWVNDIRNDSK